MPSLATISSRSNPAVARFRETRDGRDNRSILVEGRRLVEEFLDSPLTPREAAVTPALAADPRVTPLLEALKERGAAVHVMSPAVMDFLSDLETSPGIAVRADRPQSLDLSLLYGLGAPTPLIVLLDALQSPANVGAILRSAEAAGVSAVGALPGTADPLSPKSLRSSAGSAFRVPLFRAPSIQELVTTFDIPPAIVAADASGPRTYFEWNWTQPCLLILGGEARGVDPKSLEDLAVERVKIPMEGRVESLNVAVAAGILLMEARRQRTPLHPRSAIA